MNQNAVTLVQASWGQPAAAVAIPPSGRSSTGDFTTSQAAGLNCRPEGDSS